MSNEKHLAQIEVGDTLRLLDRTRGTLVAERLILALTFARRARGLLARPPLAEDEAMLLYPCGSVHTFFMRVTIDVMLLDADQRVVCLYPNLPPWRMTRPRRFATATIELPPGRLETAQIVIGDRLAFESRLA